MAQTRGASTTDLGSNDSQQYQLLVFVSLSDLKRPECVLF